MPLYFDEVWIKDPDPAKMKKAIGIFTTLATSPQSVASSTDVRVVAGPWLSNEEAKVLVVLDIVDHTPNVQTFGHHIAAGLFERRRLTPIVSWSEAQKLADSL